MSLDIVKDGNNKQLSHRVLSVTPDKDGIIPVHRLLGGRELVQTIGAALDTVMVRCVCTRAEYDNLLAAYGTGAYTQVDFEGDYWDGLIRQKPTVAGRTRGHKSTRVYEAAFELTVHEKG
jgi:hypothetical protein